MNFDYYILSGNERKGPYDLVAMMKQIRNKSVSSDTKIQRSDAATIMEASAWSELSDFFKDQEDYVQESKSSYPYSLTYALKIGIRFLNQNQLATVFAGFLVLIIILAASSIVMLPFNFRAPAAMLAYMFVHFIGSAFQFSVLRMSRGQPVGLEYTLSRIMPSAFKLMRSALLVSFPILIGAMTIVFAEGELNSMIIGWLIIVLPGFYIITIYTFVPLLVIDQEYDLWEAMTLSRKIVLYKRSESFGLFLSLNGLNFIAIIAGVLPIVLVFPMTASAIAEMYDDLS
ncbi:MAG: hypothetical protein WCL30_01650 [Pseudomonadota bacterium]